MKCLVTGAAGFIGSHLCERLVADGYQVVGVDAFVPYYPAELKRNNLASLMDDDAFEFHERDLCGDRLEDLFDGVDVVFHEAAMPGLSASWTDFDGYLSCNVTATQRLLEAWRTCGQSVERFLYASTSSVYGRYASGDESMPTRPISPYGVTKLAAENLCRAYVDAFGLPLVTVRYFSVYGPRQRPDMGYHRFIRASIRGEAVTVCGDGQQARGNTYVGDAVDATLKCAQGPVGETYNVGGGELATVWDVLTHIERISGRRLAVERAPARPGDQQTTLADTTKLRQLGWRAETSLADGLRRQYDWQLAPAERAGVKVAK